MHKTTKRHHGNSDLSRDIEKIKAAISGAAWHAKNRASNSVMQSLTDLQDKTTEMQENVSEYVAERPFKSVGLTLLAGVVIGYFLPHGKK